MLKPDETMTTSELLGGEGRQSGRTTAMLNACIDAVLEGQPKCVVIGASLKEVHRLLSELYELLLQRVGFDYVDCRYMRIYYEGSEIRFIGLDDYGRFIHSHQGYGEFWDHYAEEEVEKQVEKIIGKGISSET